MNNPDIKIFSNITPVEYLLKETGSKNALLVYWPEAFYPDEFDKLCNNSQVGKIVGCNGDGRQMLEYDGTKIIRTDSGILQII